MPREFANLEEFKAAVGTQLGTSEWLTITQERINLFADATNDHQWIHVDPERAATGPFGTTIAHGYLTLSLISALAEECYSIAGLAMGVNYGANKVRFPAPVPVDSRVRATAELVAATDIAMGTQCTIKFVVEIEGGAKPALVAEIIFVLA